MGVATSRGCFSTKRREMASRELRATVLVREREIEELKRIMQQAAWEQERQAAALASKEAAWGRERWKHEAEVARLRKKTVEGENWRGCLAECVKEEQTRREEAAGRWKQLYLAIKTELDDLIQRTREEMNKRRYKCGMCNPRSLLLRLSTLLGYAIEAEKEGHESMIERLQEELRESEETVEALRSCVAVMQMEAARKDREIDILRQSLRILGGWIHHQGSGGKCQKKFGKRAAMQ